MVNDFQMLREHRPEVPPPTDDVRRRSRVVVAEAVGADAARRRRVPRLAVAGVVLVATMVLVVVGGPEAPPPQGNDPPPWLLRPQPAGALTEVAPAGDMIVVRFLHPDADPERIEAELAEQGLALDVAFVPTDPFSVGTIVAESSPPGSPPIETLRQGTDLTGGGFGRDVGIKVPRGWKGDGYALTLGRPALPGETFDSTVAINAERPAGPLHCAGVFGMRPADAANVVQERGYRVVWRTNERRGVTGMYTSEQQPPADYWIVDAHWHSAHEIILFTDAQRPGPRDPVVEELVTRGCEGKSR